MTIKPLWYKIHRSKPLTIEEMDDVYALPYMRTYHPSYEKKQAVCLRSVK